ncbi:hypothetical protein AV645_10315 [Acinetobacter calcoaceticus]|uniref:Uncharacterized protein n=1 Tax=Acinetobacter oleivorans TaxID=1148157 RepID=A0A0B2UA47_9GAMM|nr:hypothetical protein DH17_05840 [Acinetobacter oleivorans]KUM12035.1 hypothetical protein AV645_10315 [Acinetobacter calcoaceticus]
MINLNKTLNRRPQQFVKYEEIHNFIHRFCGKLWKSPKSKHFAHILNASVKKKQDFCIMQEQCDGFKN